MILDEYFFINIRMLKGHEIFPFHIYAYSHKLDKVEIFLNANDPLTKEKLALLVYITQNNGEVAISIKQKLTYLNYFNLNPKDVNPIQHEVHPHEKERLVNLKKFESKFKKNINYEEELFNAFKKNDFKNIIERTQIELSILPLDKSLETSRINRLSKYLKDDLQSNRIVATCYFMAKVLKIDDITLLSNLILASFVYHLGEMHLPGNLLEANLNEVSENDYKNYKRHINLTFNILKKLELELSSECIEIIEQHHELTTYSGYPKGLGKEQINPMALILGGVSILFESSQGRYFTSQGDLIKDLEYLFENTDKVKVPPSFGDNFKKVFYKLISEHKLGNAA